MLQERREIPVLECDLLNATTGTAVEILDRFGLGD